MKRTSILSFAAAMLFASGGALAQTSADYTKSMDNLLAAADQVRESIQAMAQHPPGEQRDKAIEQAHEALLETQRAMFALPPELRSGGPSAAAGATDDSMQHLTKAADRLREAVQEMADQKAVEGRSEAMEQANAALLETYEAMFAVPMGGTAAAAGGSAEQGPSQQQDASRQQDKSWVEKSRKTYDERTDADVDTKDKAR